MAYLHRLSSALLLLLSSAIASAACPAGQVESFQVSPNPPSTSQQGACSNWDSAPGSKSPRGNPWAGKSTYNATRNACYIGYWYELGNDLGLYPTPEATCGPWAASGGTTATWTGSQCRLASGYLQTPSQPGNFDSPSVSSTCAPPPTCPAGTVRSEALNQCVSQLEKDCKDRQGAGTGVLEVDGGLVSAGGGGSPSTVCDTTAGDQGDTAAGMGCTVTNLVLDIGFQSGQPPRQIYRMRGTYGGTACTQDPAVTSSTSTTPTNTPTVATSPTEKPKCPGGIMQVVSGLVTCIAFKDYLTQTTTNTSDGTVTTAADGTKTEVKNDTTTACANGVCTSTTTTTTITKNAAGTVTGTTTAPPVVATEGKGDFCGKNPNSSQCGGAGQGGDGKGEGSAFGGSCVAGFQCDGDAAICAIAKAGNELKCALVDKVSPESTAYEAAKTATPSTPTTTTTFSAESFDTSNFLNTSAAGMEDMELTIAGSPFLMKFSKVNPWLELLGSLLMGVGFLLAARILLRG